MSVKTKEFVEKEWFVEISLVHLNVYAHLEPTEMPRLVAPNLISALAMLFALTTWLVC